jgi:signal transduction histidine kinase
VAEVAHDLLQPIVTISALAAMALLHDIPPAVRSCIQHIAAEAKVSVDLCLGLIVESHAREPVEVDLLVAAVARSAGVRHGITIDVISSPALVEGDPVTLRRTVDNVVENACRSAGSGGRVEVHVAGGDGARIEVHDSGLGFGDAPPGVASLGLGIVRRIVAEHGGAMTIETSPLGGACVRLELPSPPRERGGPVRARAVPRRR